jgi:hypothetical protein
MRLIGETGSAYWRRTAAAEAKLFNSLTDALKPYPVPRITRATVGGRRVANPSSYLSLYRLKKTGCRYPVNADWKRIRLHAATSSPWTDAAAVLSYAPKTRTLERDGELLRLPKTVARAVRTAAAVRLPAGSTR